MKARRRRSSPLIAIGLTAALFFAPAGCASAFLTPFESRPYIGARMDYALVSEGYWLAIFDLPFSFILDTILLPYTLPAAYGTRAG